MLFYWKLFQNPYARSMLWRPLLHLAILTQQARAMIMLVYICYFFKRPLPKSCNLEASIKLAGRINKIYNEIVYITRSL